MRVLLLVVLLCVVVTTTHAANLRERRTKILDSGGGGNGEENANKEVLLPGETQVPCTLIDDCPQKSCMVSSCEEGVCAYTDYVCSMDGEDSCTISLGCDVETNTCRYDTLQCDDMNACTDDICVRNASSAYCAYKERPDCNLLNTHDVQFRVENARHLQVKPVNGGKQVEICHTSTIMDVQEQAVLLGFSPYNDCSLADRGTCDNRQSILAVPELWTVANTAQPSEIAYVSSTLLWDEDSMIIDLVSEHGEVSTHLYGYMRDSVNEGFKLRVDIYFSGIGKFLQGNIMARAGSQYDGLVIELDSATLIMGYGANGVDVESGFYMAFTARIAHQAHEAALAIAYVDEHTGFLRGTMMKVPARPVDYCRSFNAPPSELWTMTRDDARSTTTYCMTATIEDLLHCRAYDDSHTSLFTVEKDAMTVVQGALHHTIFGRPQHCLDGCDVPTRTSTVYNITLFIDDGLIRHARVDHVDFDLQVEWAGSRWLCCTEEDAGNLLVDVETFVEGAGRRLVNPRIDAETETGVPLRFIAADDNVVTSDDDGTKQVWALRSYDNGDAVDFSGVKRLLWDVVEGMHSVGHIVATMNVQARHVGSQEHALDGHIEAELSLYTDRFFTQPSIDRSLDGTQLYATMCLNTHRHLDILIDKVAVCYSDYNINSCKDPNVNVVTLFSRKSTDNISTIHGFEFVRNPPSTAHCEGFTFLTRGYTRTKQLLQVTWTTQELGGSGGVIEMFGDDDDDGDGHHWSNDGVHEFHSNCPHTWAFDWDAGHCREWDGNDRVLFWLFFVFFILLLLFLGCWGCNRWSKARDDVIVAQTKNNMYTVHDDDASYQEFLRAKAEQENDAERRRRQSSVGAQMLGAQKQRKAFTRVI